MFDSKYMISGQMHIGGFFSCPWMIYLFILTDLQIPMLYINAKNTKHHIGAHSNDANIFGMLTKLNVTPVPKEIKKKQDI